MCWSDSSCLGLDVEQLLGIETSFLPKDHSLSDRLHANTQQRVDHQLHCCSRARTAQKKVLSCHRLEYWLSRAEQFSVAAYQKRQAAFFGGRSAARDCDIQRLDATL